MVVNTISHTEPDRKGTYSSILEGHHSKTIDLGYNGHTVSAGPSGDILQVGCFHPIHGVIVACPFEQFSGERFYDPEYVRSYRQKLLEYVRHEKSGFGISINGDRSHIKIEFVDNQWVLFTYSLGAFQVSQTLSVDQDGTVVQSTRIRSQSTRKETLKYALALNVSINRASYGQLTEGGPIPIPIPSNTFALSEDRYVWSVTNSNLDGILEGSLSCDGLFVQLDPELEEISELEKPVSARCHGTIDIMPGAERTLVSTFKLRPGEKQAPITPFHSSVSKAREHWKLTENEITLIIQRNLAYILGNCTVPVGRDTICFITDHVALPLGWNRDNYWQIRYLLDVYHNIDRIVYPQTAKKYASIIRSSVKGHLKWALNLAQRPHGYWHRSYLATGTPKDGPVFQLDQQCYPILELCDFLEAFPSESAFVQNLLEGAAIPSVLAIIKELQDNTTGLYPTEETPGDDAVEYPFHFSSHVLLWYTFSRLATIVKSLLEKEPSKTKLALNSSELYHQAAEVRASTFRYFVGKNPLTGTTMFAYLTDGNEQHTFYHDANDIPTLLIPAWGFIDRDNSSEYALWTNTMDFGLSPANSGGFYPDGPFGGLGSVHTRGPWPLGFAQEYIYSCVRNDAKGRDDALRRIKGSMFWDGLFSEAVDAQTGCCVSKAWFSWPGAMIGSALLKFSNLDSGPKSLI